MVALGLVVVLNVCVGLGNKKRVVVECGYLQHLPRKQLVPYVSVPLRHNLVILALGAPPSVNDDNNRIVAL